VRRAERTDREVIVRGEDRARRDRIDEVGACAVPLLEAVAAAPDLRFGQVESGLGERAASPRDAINGARREGWAHDHGDFAVAEIEQVPHREIATGLVVAEH
jgi:hypothetical protein